MTPTPELPGGPDAWGIMAQLWRLIQGVSDQASPGLQAMGLTAKSLGILAAVDDHPFPAELARLMVLPPPTVTYIVKQLEARAYLRRQAEPGDLRKYRLVVTDAGRQALRAGSLAVGEQFALRLARLDVDELAMFERLVERLAR